MSRATDQRARTIAALNLYYVQNIQKILRELPALAKASGYESVDAYLLGVEPGVQIFTMTCALLSLSTREELIKSGCTDTAILQGNDAGWQLRRTIAKDYLDWKNNGFP